MRNTELNILVAASHSWVAGVLMALMLCLELLVSLSQTIMTGSLFSVFGLFSPTLSMSDYLFSVTVSLLCVLLGITGLKLKL